MIIVPFVSNRLYTFTRAYTEKDHLISHDELEVLIQKEFEPGKIKVLYLNWFLT